MGALPELAPNGEDHLLRSTSVIQSVRYRTNNVAYRANGAEVIVLTKDAGGPQLAYRIAMGVRYADQDWKRLLNRTIRENQPVINKLLLSFGVPLLDDSDRPITEDSIAK